MTGSFQGLPIKASSLDGRHFTLLEPLVFTRPNGDVLTVPAGTDTDGASTPPVLWPTIPPFGLYWPAAVLHDWCYRHSTLDKATCDSVISEAMEALGVNEIERITIYEGVHYGGWKSFTQDRAERIAKNLE